MRVRQKVKRHDAKACGVRLVLCGLVEFMFCGALPNTSCKAKTDIESGEILHKNQIYPDIHKRRQSVF